jgi:membrane complex biogenesis BtpA family protein
MTRPRSPKLVGVIHLAPLPGSPRAVESADDTARAAAEDARILREEGYDAVIVENFGDTPFLPRVGAVTVSAMTLASMRVRDACPDLPLGVNILRNDADAALAVAAVVGAAFVRVNVHVGARVTDQGVIDGEAGATLRTRRALGATGVEVWADVAVKHSAPLGVRPVADEAADAALRGMADAILVTGEGTGRAVDEARLVEVRRAVSVPVYVASGGTIGTLPRLAPLCDGVIVGSALRASGKAGGRVDRGCAAAFARAFREAFSRP